MLKTRCFARDSRWLADRPDAYSSPVVPHLELSESSFGEICPEAGQLCCSVLEGKERGGGVAPSLPSMLGLMGSRIGRSLLLPLAGGLHQSSSVPRVTDYAGRPQFHRKAQGTTLSTWSGEQRGNDGDRHPLPGLVDRSFIDGGPDEFQKPSSNNVPTQKAF